MNNSEITVVILTKNSQATLEDAIKSAKFANQILIIDDNSTDKTVELAKKTGVDQVFSRSLSNNFAAQRNFAIDKVTTCWVLFLDSDETISKALSQEIQAAIQPSKHAGYKIPRKDIFQGKTLKFGETSQINLLRLAKKESGKWVGNVHETWSISGNVGQLSNPILHQPHNNITSFIAKINNYTSIQSKISSNQSKIEIYTQTIIKPCAKFLLNYIFRLGFLDGYRGLVYAYTMSLHSLSVRVKTYENKTKK